MFHSCQAGECTQTYMHAGESKRAKEREREFNSAANCDPCWEELVNFCAIWTPTVLHCTDFNGVVAFCSTVCLVLFYFISISPSLPSCYRRRKWRRNGTTFFFTFYFFGWNGMQKTQANFVQFYLHEVTSILWVSILIFLFLLCSHSVPQRTSAGITPSFVGCILCRFLI